MENPVLSIEALQAQREAKTFCACGKLMAYPLEFDGRYLRCKKCPEYLKRKK